MQIHGLGQVHGPQAIRAPHTQPAAPAESAQPASDNINIDQLDISPEADAASRARESAEARQNRVAEIRQQIANGTYETDAKLEIALSRVLDELA